MAPHRLSSAEPSEINAGIDAGVDDDLHSDDLDFESDTLVGPNSGVVRYADEENSDDAEGTPSFARNLLEWAAILGGALVVALVVTKFLVQAFFIPSASMFPTLEIDDRVLVNKLSYDLHEVNRGDLVVFERPPSEAESDIKDLIKRVVAVEGDTVGSQDGKLVINGVAMEEPYVAEGAQTSGVETQTIPPGHVFVMGDNREDSRDSRFFGPLDEELIIGRAFVKVWPLTDLGLL
ncbi:MAG TPA: signal peptidase I [Acidimicrobiales bacterium]|nr:signal peptidase I [Acidimicrobiales bacterium]